ncbi:hypothetical protein GCM10010840_06220 [Deinococcus aerolatus]|uniref:Uncharacterized protein n=1 Tax=Deinococcus aerolatus TaxID=522487 RepID=A0ABQ2G1N9_9DEIO|nr:hypothetical protein [Deinococcus aerolatus]GGL70862.1 hypothetical protein GCM10010840_06220 [Deinococcus aerolatus]
MQGQTRLCSGGDTARLKHPTSAGDCPFNGMWASHNMARSLQAWSLKRFSYRRLGQAPGLERSDGVGELLGVPLTGSAAWWLRRLFLVWHMPPKVQGARFGGNAAPPPGAHRGGRPALNPRRR